MEWEMGLFIVYSGLATMELSSRGIARWVWDVIRDCNNTTQMIL
jgi:hypothetical protein